MEMTVEELAGRIDHTLLKPEATAFQIEALCREAIEFRVASVCVTSARVGLATKLLHQSGVPVCSVIGFPSGAMITNSKVAEALSAAAMGASEFDMVLLLGALKDGDDSSVGEDIAAVRKVIPAPYILKVIIESAVLTSDEVVRACMLAVDAGADFVKTSTGFHPSGGGSLEAVRLMKSTVGDSVRVKAAGGVRDTETALALIRAGADRLGASSTAAILRGMSDR